MRGSMSLRLLAVTVFSLQVGACGNPYGIKLSSANYQAKPIDGEIAFTDPKLYRREALINERREERTYLNGLIDGSKTVTFTPEIVRQLEVVRVLSGSLGLKFDPAAGAQYKRSEEKADIQQQIDTLQLQMQLDKLKRDAELMREQLTKQTEPSPAPSPSPGAPSASVPPVTPNAAKDLVASIESLKIALATLANSKVEALLPVSMTNPIDEYNDRAAYREILNGARNAISLDELHDYNGSALIRLNTTATVFPPEQSHRATYGRLKMQIKAPDRNDDPGAFNRLYRDWLSSLAKQIAQSSGSKDGLDLSTIGGALAAYPDLLDIVWFEYSTKPRQGCRGLGHRGPAAKPGCMTMPIATPRVLVHGSQQDYSLSLQDLADKFADKSIDYPGLFRQLAASGTLRSLYRNDCIVREEVASQKLKLAGIPVSFRADQIVPLALALDRLMWVAPFAESQAQAEADNHGLSQIFFDPYNGISPGAASAAREVAAQVRAGAEANHCGSSVATPVPPSFLAALDYGHAAVYQVGPKQQVQIVSTEARAAEAIALAASVAGSVPAKGIGADAGINFSRSAVGKTDALERVPLVVAFGDAAGKTTGNDLATRSDSTDDLPAFGWMMGPRAILDPEHQKLNLEQGLRPQDLSVDLVVPGWWPYLAIEAEASWSPDWQGRGGKSGVLSGIKRVIKVPLSQNLADYEQLTNRILGGSSIKIPRLIEVIPAIVPACSTGLSMQLQGPQVWRTDQVIIGGRKFDGDTLRVLPGLEGIMVTIDKAEFPALEGAGANRQTQVYALTPYGPTNLPVTITGIKDDGCAVVKPDKP